MRRELKGFFDRWGQRSRDLAAAEDGQERHGYYGVVMACLLYTSSSAFSTVTTARSTPAQ